MRIRKLDSTSKRPYAKISLKKREMLVQDVLQQGLAISKAAKKHRIKLTTARLIIRKYKETGGFPMKKFRNSFKPVEEDRQWSQSAVRSAQMIETVNNQQNPIKNELPSQTRLIEAISSNIWTPQIYICYIWPYPQPKIC